MPVLKTAKPATGQPLAVNTVPVLLVLARSTLVINLLQSDAKRSLTTFLELIVTTQEMSVLHMGFAYLLHSS
jgi:hypothetical protein